MTQLSLNLLGSPHVAIDAVSIQIVRRKSLAILVYLTETADVQRRDKLATLFWPDSPQGKARGALRRELSSLNHDLGPGWLSADRETATLSESADVVLDTAGFQTLLANENVNNGDAAREPTADAVVRLTSAIDLYRGDFLSGFTLPNCIEFDDWQFYQTEGYRQALASALEYLCALLVEQGEFVKAIPYQRRQLSLDPLHEPAHRALMQLYAQADQRSAALRQYEECRRILEHELDVPPEATTTDLFDAIRLHRYPPPDHLTPLATTEVADDALSSPEKQTVAADETELPMLLDQNRVVTVLAIGMSQASQAIWDLPADEAAMLIRSLIDLVVEVTATYQGVVDHLLTDGAVALFGAMQTHEDDPERATLAALRIRQAAADLPLDVSAGITTGMVYLSGVSLGDRTELTALGAPVSLATRLQGLAGKGQILVSDSTYRQTRGALRTAPFELTVRGRDEAITVYQVIRKRRHPHKTRGIEGLQADLVGREEELKRLSSALHSVVRKHPNAGGHAISLVGEAGVGKSRLVAELKLVAEANTMSTTHMDWLAGRCLEMTTENAYSLFIDVLNQIFGFQADDSQTGQAAAIRSTLYDLARQNWLSPQQTESMGPLFGNLLSVKFGDEWDERLHHTGPEQIRFQTLAAIRDLLLARSRRGPVVLVLEDLHWADDLSIDLISLLLDALGNAPLLLLCVYRPERDHRCWQIGSMASRKCPDHFMEIRLHELTSTQSGLLVSSLLRREAIPLEVREMILARAQGNPFYIEEIVHSLINQGYIVQEGASWRGSPDRADQALQATIPESVHGVILSRVDRLPPETRHVLQKAAVLGRLFSGDILVTMTPDAQETEDALDELADQALVYQERAVPESLYAFRHVLVQEAIYATIPGDRRRNLHANAGAAIEAAHAKAIERQIDILAYHYDRSDENEKAVEYLLRAGEKARRTYLNDVAEDYFQRALVRLEERPPSAAQEERLFTVHLGLGKLYALTSDYEQGDEHLRLGLEQGKSMALPISRLAPIYQWLGDLLINWAGHAEEAIRLCLEGLELAGRGSQSAETAMIEGILGFAYEQVGDFMAKSKVVDHLARYVADLPYQEELSTAYNVIADDYFSRKETEAGFEWLELALDQYRRANDLRRTGEWLSGFLDGFRGADYEQALATWNEGRSALVQTGDEKRLNRKDFEAGALAFDYGRLDLALAEVTDAIQRAPGLNDEHLPHMLRWKSEIHMARGEPKRAIEILQEVLPSFTGPRLSPAEVLVPLARAELAVGNRYDAIQHLEEALAVMGTPDSVVSALDYSTSTRSLFADALASLESAYGDQARFQAFCHAFLAKHPQASDSQFKQWMLTSATSPATSPGTMRALCLEKSFPGTIDHEFSWVDPVGDIVWNVNDGLEIYVPNFRDLWWNYLTAPRLLRPIDGDFAIETTCLPLRDDRPAIGGILLWQDKRNYLRLDRGTRGPGEVSLQGCINNEDLVFGRGTLLNDCMWLRLERTGDTVRGLCSADGENWYSVGVVDFPTETRLQVGIFAAGNIDRTFYHGAYQDGSAIRFESITIW